MAKQTTKMSTYTYKRRVGTHKQPLGVAITSTEESWGTPNRSLSEQRSVDGRDHGPAGETSTSTGLVTNPSGSVTLEGNQWYAEGRPISVGDLDYHLGLVADPSHTENRDDKAEVDLVENDTTMPSNQTDLSVQENLDELDEEHGIFLELPNTQQQCPKCSIVFNTVRILKTHLTDAHRTKEILFRCRLCKETFDKVHRLECHAPRCKAIKRPPSAGAYPFQCQTCTTRYKSRSGLSQHERHHHPDVANQRRINAGRQEAERKREQRRVARELTNLKADESQTPPPATSPEEAPKPKTRWDETATGIFVDLLRQQGDIKGLHEIVRTALKENGYEFSLKQISSKKRTKGFQSAVVEGHSHQTEVTGNKRKANGDNNSVTGESRTTRNGCTREPEVHPDVPKANTKRVAPAGKDERMNDLTVEQLFCCLEDSEESTEREIAALGRIVQQSKEEQNEAKDQEAEQAYSKHETLLEEYISSIQPSETGGRKQARFRKETKIRQVRKKRPRGKAKERMERYRSLQQKWKANRKGAVRQILDGASDAKCEIDPEVIEETYVERFERAGPTVDLSDYPGPYSEPPLPPVTPEKRDQHTEADNADGADSRRRGKRTTRAATAEYGHILDAVSESEVKTALRTMRTGSAAGPDHLSVQDLKRKVGERPGFLAGVYTIWLMAGKVPEKLKESRSILLPKGTSNLDQIGNWRPLSISSVLLRLYSKILAKRLTRNITLHPAQRGFISAPGVEQNSVLLEHAIRKQKKGKGTLAVAFLDLAKAFDTVSHDLIVKGLIRLGIPNQFINVVEDMYEGATTTFKAAEGETRPIQINQGVKQGDPLSPILFNVCLDPLFCSLERNGIGWTCEDMSVTALGYADDTAVLSNSREGLERNLSLVQAYCDRVGLRLNVKKSYVFHIRSDGKTFTVNNTAPYMVGGEQIPWIKPEESTRYLGKMFGPWKGMTVPNLKRQIDDWASNVAAAPLKPFQALEIWRGTILPRVKARILHSRPSMTMLKDLDVQIRGHIKRLLHLPEAVTNALMYTKTKHGGLGITCLSDAVPDLTIKGLHKLCWQTPSLTIRRLARSLGVRKTLEDMCVKYPEWKPVPPSQKSSTTPTGIDDSDETSRGNGNSSVPKEKWCRYWANQGTQGTGTDTWMRFRESNSWIRAGTYTEGEAISALLLRTNCVPTRECTSRYTNMKNVQCRRCGTTVETTGHISGWCPSVKRSRILRHDSLCKILSNKAVKAGWTPHWEPVFDGPSGKLKPDLVFVKNEQAVIVDPTVIWEKDSKSLDDAATGKEDKYSCIQDQVKDRFEISEVQVFGLPVGARGGWTQRNDRVLKALGLSRDTITALTTRALGGTIMLMRLFFDD